ncbi:MAG: asparagine synthase [Alphaproteobacteria bacterium]|nr:asparagine synthase [Alphaproteobacteria bacterium]
MNVKSSLNPIYKWKTLEIGKVTVNFQGVISCLKELAELVEKPSDDVFEKIKTLLLKEYEHFSCILETDELIFACVDWCRSRPVFYGIGKDSGIVSNCARTAKNEARLEKSNNDGVLEYSMAAYVTGNETVYENLFQLQSGECLIWRLNEEKPQTHRYYRYIPKPEKIVDEKVLEKELGEIIDNIMHRAIKTADGAPLWLPLSGGLDSRLLLAKLVEFGYKNIQTFSYGVKSNHEAITAKRIAAKLGVPWFELAAEPKLTETLWNTKERKDYESFADGLASCPIYLDFEAFYKLVKDKKMPSEAVIMNGQSGDYITGAHIPESLYSKTSLTMDDFYKAVETKHFSLWDDLKEKPENISIIKKRVLDLLPNLPKDISDYEKICTYYESWEWQERQSKLVVNGQRIYEHFGLKWVMPLWDGELMNFWEIMPIHLKTEQNFHVRYLQNYNYKGVFDTLRDAPETWTPKYRWIPWAARTIGLLKGKKAKEDFYKRMYYYSTYNDQYALLGHDSYLKNYKKARGIVSFFSKQWLEDNGFSVERKG